MASTAIKSQLTTLAKGSGASPQVWTTVTNLTGISGPNLEAQDIEVTDLSSTAKEYLQGLEDSGVIDVTGYYDQTVVVHQEVRDNVGANIALDWKITFSDAETMIFQARVSAWSLDLGVDGAVEMSATLKISGAVAFSS